jgi:hypothetical protein
MYEPPRPEDQHSTTEALRHRGRRLARRRLPGQAGPGRGDHRRVGAHLFGDPDTPISAGQRLWLAAPTGSRCGVYPAVGIHLHLGRPEPVFSDP